MQWSAYVKGKGRTGHFNAQMGSGNMDGVLMGTKINMWGHSPGFAILSLMETTCTQWGKRSHFPSRWPKKYAGWRRKRKERERERQRGGERTFACLASGVTAQNQACRDSLPLSEASHAPGRRQQTRGYTERFQCTAGAPLPLPLSAGGS